MEMLQTPKHFFDQKIFGIELFPFINIMVDGKLYIAIWNFCFDFRDFNLRFEFVSIDFTKEFYKWKQRL